MAPIDSSKWADYGQIDPAFEALLPHLPPLKSFADYGTAADLRAAIATQVAQLQSSGLIKTPDWTGVEKREISIPVRDGTSLRAVVYRSETAVPGPLAVYFHGGGWTFGWPESWEHGFEVLVKQCGFTAVGVGYRLAPEHVFPTAAEDACDSLRWCGENAESLSADPNQGFVVAGTSAGADLAGVAAHDFVAKGGLPALTGVVLVGAGLVHHEAVPEEWREHHRSREQNRDAPVLDVRGIEWFFEQYKPVPGSPYASTLLWPGGHAGQPPTYMQAMGMDPLRDGTLIYEHVLREEYNVPTKLDVYAGVPHCAPDFFPMLPLASKALEDLKAGVEWILSQKPR
ncbi:esterase lipase [Stagonosporopsis vannaccii]|nr:esterase lipase [Stagonosporopsis vannaccii]